MAVTIFVISHEASLCLAQDVPEIYKILQVGAGTSSQRFGDFQDDDGENISNKNQSFCELTGLYWVWKNVKADIVGICHYRRFLMDSADHCLPKFFLDEKKIESILEKYDVILPKPFYEEITIKEFYENGMVNKKNELIVLRDVVGELYPEYLCAFDDFFYGNKEIRCNVMIMKKKELDKYCKWLFGILFEVEKRIDVSTYNKVDIRIFGYLAERLLNIYVAKNDLRVYHCHMETVKSGWKYKIKCLLDSLGLLGLVRRIPSFKTDY